jgi:hypothetical protein
MLKNFHTTISPRVPESKKTVRITIPERAIVTNVNAYIPMNNTVRSSRKHPNMKKIEKREPFCNVFLFFMQFPHCKRCN